MSSQETGQETGLAALSGDPVTRLGYGISGPLGAAWFSESKVDHLIDTALALGIRQFDTSPLYGKAEERLGRALSRLSAGDRAGLGISTKVGNFLDRSGVRRRDFSENTIRRLVDQSLARLGVDAIDVLYLHGPDKHEFEASLPVLADLKSSGLIRRTGLCSNRSLLAHAAGHDGIDVLMGSYNFLYRDHEETFRDATIRGKRIVAIAPLAQGLYRRSFFMPRSPADAWYLARALVRNRTALRNARRLDWLHEIEGWDAPSLALAFTLANPAVDCAMLTTTRPAHLRANVAAARRTLEPDLHRQLEKIAQD